MTLVTKPKNVVEVKKKTRLVLEKLHDLTFGKKYQKRISRNAIAKRLGKDTDVQVCIHFIIECYKCYLNSQPHLDNLHSRQYQTLLKHVSSLDIQISSSVKHQKPVRRKYVSDVLKAHSNYFNSLKSGRFNKECEDVYDKFLLSAISVWNNHWK